jgi:hypothetical protein
MGRMQLCLVVPGLLWPRQAHYDTAYDLELPALARWLGHGDIRWDTVQSYESWLGRAFGVTAAELPAAALRLIGAGTDPGKDFWTCADAAHIGLEHGAPALTAVGMADIDAEQAEQLTDALAPALAALGEFRMAAGGLGSVRLRQAPEVLTTPPSAAIGRRADTVDVREADARQWRRSVSEAQMLLHAHPINKRRLDAGKPPVNTLWLWGAGRLPEAAAAAPWSSVRGGEASLPLLRGLAAWSRTALQPAADCASLLPGSSERSLVCLDDLLPPLQGFDAMAWRDAVLRLEADWLAPLDAALRRGRIAKLTLVGLGDEAVAHTTLTPWSRHRFWRRPRPLADLHYPAAA